MLTIPDEIKELLHQDTCRKNIRIHFPNGERTDICNNLIVKGSVGFTESLCSRDSLKFGLCESPVFECETVGVGNIKGAEIQVYCEIYCDPSVSGAIFQQDLQAYVYSLPYGSFIVDGSQRQADMIHRKILAYGAGANTDNSIGKFESLYKRTATSLTGVYDPCEFLYALANIDSGYNETLFDATEVTYEDYTVREKQVTYMIKDSYGAYTVAMRTSFYAKRKRWVFDNVSLSISDLNNMFTLICDYSPREEKLDELYQYFVQDVADYYQNPPTKASFYSSLGRTVDIHYDNSWCLPVGYNSEKDLPLNFYGYYDGRKLTIDVVYEYEVIGRNGNYDTGPIIRQKSSGDFTSDCRLMKYALKSYFQFIKSFTLSIPMMVIDSDTATPKYVPLFSGLEKYDAQKSMNDNLELLGVFGRVDRNKTFEIINIKQQFGLVPGVSVYPDPQLYPGGSVGGQIRPNEYRSCWYDDEYTKKFGAVQCTYTDTNNQQAIHIEFLGGFDDSSDPDTYQVYILDNNEIISSHKWTQAQIETICQSIANNISNVTYMPVNLVGIGLPYVESGDTFEILTKSNDSIITIVLDRTLNGEQTLVDSYKSSNG